MLVTQLILKLEPLLVFINQCALHQLVHIASLYQFRATIAEVLYCIDVQWLDLRSTTSLHQLVHISILCVLFALVVHSTAYCCSLQSIEPTGHVCQLLVQPSINHPAGPNLVTGCSVRKTHFMPRTDFGPIMCNFGKTCSCNVFYAWIYLLRRCQILAKS